MGCLATREEWQVILNETKKQLKENDLEDYTIEIREAYPT